MSLMDMLGAAQGGRLFGSVAKATGLGEAEAKAALGTLCPAIAQRLHARAAEDDALFQSLLDLIADNGPASPLEDAAGLTSSEALADGNAILEDVYGSRSAAMAELRLAAPSLPEADLARLAPIAATAVVAALAQSNTRTVQGVMAPQQAAATGRGGQGFFAALVGAVIAGLMQALSRQLAPSRRRRSTTSYSRSRSQRRTSASRSRQTASVEDVFRDILGNLGKR